MFPPLPHHSACYQIADFGLSQIIQPGESLTKICGTWAYAAPEMSDHSKPGYTANFDIWGFGVIMFIVLCGYHPFDPEGGLPVDEVCVSSDTEEGVGGGGEGRHAQSQGRWAGRAMVYKKVVCMAVSWWSDTERIRSTPPSVSP